MAIIGITIGITMPAPIIILTATGIITARDGVGEEVRQRSVARRSTATC